MDMFNDRKDTFVTWGHGGKEEGQSYLGKMIYSTCIFANNK